MPDVFLYIDGIEFHTQRPGAEQEDSTLVGSLTRAHSGKLRAQSTAEKRNWRFLLAPVTQAVHNDLRTRTDRGKFVNCSGAALGGTVLCHVRITAAAYVADRHDPLGFKRVLAVALTEV